MDPIKKAMYLGLGAISLTKEKAEEIIDDLIKRGEMSGDNRTSVVEQLLKEAEVEKDKLGGKVSESVRKAVTDLGLPTRKEFETIVSRLDGIEKTIGTLKQEKRGKKG